MLLRMPSPVVLGILAVLLPGCTDSIQPLDSLESQPRDSSTDGPADPLASPAVIFLADADGSDAVRLTEGGWPAWSPGGQRIAFHRDGEVHVIKVDGSAETTLVEGKQPVWSPDGSQIAFATGEEIAVMRADGSGSPTVIHPEYRNGPFADMEEFDVSKPAWSPNGERIAFERRVDPFGWGDALTQVYVMNADGSDARRLTSTSGTQYAESDPAWSPDGSRISFWSFGTELTVVHGTGGVGRTVHRTSPEVSYGANPAWSPDGSTITFNPQLSDDPTVWAVDSGGGSVQVLVPGGRDATWSPDGTRIAFVRDDSP